jgi:hypothetical protein
VGNATTNMGMQKPFLSMSILSIITHSMRELFILLSISTSKKSVQKGTSPSLLCYKPCYLLWWCVTRNSFSKDHSPQHTAMCAYHLVATDSPVFPIIITLLVFFRAFIKTCNYHISCFGTSGMLAVL